MTANSILSWLFETSLAVSVLIILVLALRRPAARAFGPEAAYLLWLAPLARLFLPELSVLPSPATVEAAPIVFSSASDVIGASAGVAPPQLQLFELTFLALLAWMAGAIVFLIWQLAAQQRFLRDAENNSNQAPSELRAEANLIAHRRRLKRAFDMRIMQDETGPLVAGFFRPVVLLPRSFAQDYTPEERQMALAHELAHIARGDLAAALAAIIFRALQWPNPLVHFAYGAFRTDQEAACDAAVLARHKALPDAAHAYAAAIVKAARRSAAAPACSLSIAHHLKERLMLMKTNRIRPIAGRIAAAALIGAGLLASASYGYAADKKKDKGDGETAANMVEVRKVFMLGEGDADVEVRRVIIEGDAEAIISTDSSAKPGVFVLSKDGGSEERVFRFSQDDMQGGAVISNCTAGEDDSEPVVLKFSEEKTEGDEKHKTFSIVCVSGEDAADPAKTAEMLRKAIDKMEVDAEKEAKRRARMIAGLREQLKKLEDQEKAAKKKNK